MSQYDVSLTQPHVCNDNAHVNKLFSIGFSFWLELVSEQSRIKKFNLFKIDWILASSLVITTTPLCTFMLWSIAQYSIDVHTHIFGIQEITLKRFAFTLKKLHNTSVSGTDGQSILYRKNNMRLLKTLIKQTIYICPERCQNLLR